MVISHIVEKLNETRRELQLLKRDSRADARKVRYLEQREIQLARDAGAMGFSETELKTGEINAGHDSDRNTVAGARSYLVKPPSWVIADREGKK